jgi:hypothetical protein
MGDGAIEPLDKRIDFHAFLDSIRRVPKKTSTNTAPRTRSQQPQLPRRSWLCLQFVNDLATLRAFQGSCSEGAVALRGVCIAFALVFVACATLRVS